MSFVHLKKVFSKSLEPFLETIKNRLLEFLAVIWGSFEHVSLCINVDPKYLFGVNSLKSGSVVLDTMAGHGYTDIF